MNERGLSLVSLVLTLVILALMAAIAVKAVDGQKSDRKGTGALLNELVQGAQGQADLGAGGATARAGAGAVTPTAPPAGPGGMVGAAAISACSANLALVRNAVATFQAMNSALPSSVDELVARGLLSDPPDVPGFSIALEVTDGAPTGKVLVNGKPASAGCLPA